MAIIYMNLSAILNVSYWSLAKIGTNSGIHVLDLVLFRNMMNFLVSSVALVYSGKHAIKDVPANLRGVLLLRIAIGMFGFAIFMQGLKIVPIFISSIIMNTRPFWVSILGYFVLHEKVTKFEIICISGCFIGVILIAMVKKDDEANKDKDKSKRIVD